MDTGMKIEKAVSKTVMYIGIILFVIGQILFWGRFKNDNFIGGVMTFIGFIMFVFWFSNRNDELCPTDVNDNRPCVPVS